MATNIKIGEPKVSQQQWTASISGQLVNKEFISAEVFADTSELLPWLNEASKEIVDFAQLSFFAYGIDRLIPRRANSVDGWSREISVSMPVYKLNKWKKAKNIVEKLLSFLTGDFWSLEFYQNNLEIPKKQLDKKYNQDFAQVNLFSGGLDSLVGAIDILEKSKKPILFISHYDPTMHGPKKDQSDLSDELIEKYAKLFFHIPSIKVFLSKTSLPNSETSSRSRSLLFIGMASILANSKGLDILVPENGTVSVNYPLSSSRRSACSTRTTHPTFLNYIFDLWQQLGITNRIDNPYRFKTKGEMVNQCQNQTFLETVLELSNSCGKRGHRAHWDNSGTHCGICMPCVYRRASLLELNDNTDYGNEINDLEFTTKKGQDISAMLEFLKNPITKNDIKFELISNGLKDIRHLYDYVGLIERTKKELANWVKDEGSRFVKDKAGL